MSEGFGSSRYCRICGGYHGCCGFNRCGKPSPLQIAQMNIEDLENFFAGLPILADKRIEVEKMTKELKRVLSIPEEKIYARRVLDDEEKIMAEFEKVREGFKNTETGSKNEIAPPLQYDPTIEILEQARVVFEEIYKTTKSSSCMTKPQLESFESITDAIRIKVLKETL